LLVPDRLARDQVIVSPVGNANAGRQIFNGMRVTFPVWSPTENRLSLWITFVPRYQSLLAVLFRWGLRPGDPAATLDLDTGEVSWMAVTPAEELQLGHYFLLKKDYARAWEWYERASQKLPPREPPATFLEFTETLGAPERSQFFEYLCLKQLGRHDDAKARLDEFEKCFFPADAAAEEAPTGDLNTLGPAIMADIVRQLGRDAPLVLRMIHDLYIAEVFLSVDAVDDGIAFFRERRSADDGDVNQMSREMTLSQLLLIAGRYDEYLGLSAEMLKRLEFVLPQSNDADGARDTAQASLGLSQFGIFSCLAPLFRREFLSGVDEDSLREAISGWDARTVEIKTQSDAAIDLFLRAAHQTLGNAEAAEAIEARLMAAGAAGKVAVTQKSIDDEIGELFKFLNAIGQFAQNSRQMPARRP
jgi:tetratricopeptide (TPR) repeat protein